MFHWLHHLWFTWAWPSDKGNGPEAIQQTVFYALVAVVFVPVVRKAIRRAEERIKAHVTAEHAAAHAARVAAETELHRKLDHLIKLPTKETP